MGGPAIEVSDIAKRFRLVHERNHTLKATVFNGFRRTVHEEFWALRGVSFEVQEGATYGLIGHNGSGKSTLLKCMARIYCPDRGHIITRGQLSALLELGAGFHPELSGRENVYLNASILGMSKRDVDHRFDDIVGFAGLEEFIDTPVKNYSSGMFVRLGFSVAITVEPDILLVDEVLAVGDESFQQRCMEKFADFRRSGRTIVLVSHGLDAIRSICDRAAWLDHGELIKEGDAYEVVTSYIESVRDNRRAQENERAAGPPPTSATRERCVEGWDIHRVELLTTDGQPAGVVPSGSELDIRIELESACDANVTLALDLHRTDGIHVASPQHAFRTSGKGRRTIDYHIPNLPLGNGAYDLSVEILDDHLQQVYAEQLRVARLDVQSNRHPDRGGVVAFGGTWTIN